MSTACQSCETLGQLPAPPTYPGCPPAPPAQGCSAVWGSITGLLANQEDLILYLGNTYLTPGEGDEAYAQLSEANVFTEDQTINGLTVGNGTGGSSAILGFEALSENTTGQSNVAIGSSALRLNTTGSTNTAVGSDALSTNTTASDNTAVGFSSLGSNGTGFSNTAVGVSSLYINETGSYNTAVGHNSGVTTSGLSRTTTVGFLARATKSNQAVFGDPSTTETLLRGNIALESKTITAIGTTGNQTINKTCGSVVFAAAATTLVVTNSFAVAPTSGATGSIIIATMRTNDSTAVLGNVVCSSNGAFTINMKTAPTASTRVDFILFN